MRAIFSYPKLITAGMIGLLTACSGSDGDTRVPPPPPLQTSVELTPAQKIRALEESREIPRLDRSASLAGPDTDQNGVRDDIDGEIQARVSEPAQRSAALQLAKALQAAVTVDITDPAAVRAVSLQMTNATHCLFSRFTATEGPLGAPAMSAFLESTTSNTKARLKAYLAFNAMLDGTSTSLPKGDTCE